MAGRIPDNEDSHVPRMNKWPYTMQGIFQSLGILHGGRITQKTNCYTCREKRDHGERCDVCESLQWNSESKTVAYTENDLVSSVLNSCVTRLLTILFLLGLLCFMLYDMILLVSWLWGKPDQVLHLVSFLTFWIPLLSIPGCCLTAHVCNLVQDHSASRGRNDAAQCYDDSFDHWYIVFHPNFVARRLQFLTSTTAAQSAKRIILSTMFLVLCVSWATANTGFEWLNYFISKYHRYHDFKNFLHLALSGLSLLMFGFFCYVMHLLRDSLDAEYNQVLYFLLRHQNDVDKCRHRIVELFRDYRILRRFIRSWMILILSCASLGLTVHLSWNYAVYTNLRNEDSDSGPFSDDHYRKVMTAWTNILIGSEKFMILFLPLLALGGYNIENSWKQFAHAVVLFRVDRYNSFWKKLSKVVNEIHPAFSSATVTIAWCVFSWFFGLHLGEQNTNYATSGVVQ